MHYQNDTFLFLLQEVSLKYHKSSMKYHKSSMKYHKNSLLTILPETVPNFGHSMPAVRATDAQHMGYRCPSRGL